MLVKFERNRMVRNIQILQKMVSHFGERVDAILADVPVTKTTF